MHSPIERMNESAFTQEQLAWYEAYASVQDSSKFNMLDPKAQRASGLTFGEFGYVLENYSELRAAHTKARK